MISSSYHRSSMSRASLLTVTRPRLKTDSEKFPSCGMFLDCLLCSDLKRWGIVGIGLMDWDRRMYHTLKSQDTLFTVLSRGHTGSEARVVGSIVDFLFAPENHQAVIDKVRPDSTLTLSLVDLGGGNSSTATS